MGILLELRSAPFISILILVCSTSTVILRTGLALLDLDYDATMRLEFCTTCRRHL
jgi:hypothetical protein